ncbi:uncharacterized protein LOC134754840 [Cydia strobilella]|uniref:uncharacterized protein LOC134754840 n=1 Tax=Cydia strobilella TaxID=1100964 RepID=UPI003004E2DD
MYLRSNIMSVTRVGHGLRWLSSRALAYSEEVLHAQTAGSPIVALESTIITHGMPYPQNLETAVAVETIIREKGAVPATVAILKGQLTVGLSREQLEYLARAKGVVKASRRDLAPVAAAGLDGATTVAGTLVAADLADIPVFVTGGIGGVHREGENTLDVSADLTELGRCRAAVVCSGVKSILDIGKTLEYLETQGVCVCAFGETDAFPAFYTRRSGHRAPYRTPSAAHAARVLAAARSLCLESGIVIAVPVPEEHAMDESVINEAITLALQEAKRKGIHGKDVTPYILAAVSEATGGKSLDTNMALIKNNAKVGADIAVEFNKLKNVDNLANNLNIGFSRRVDNSAGSRSFHSSCRSRGSAPLSPSEPATSEPVLVIGGANVDRTYRVAEDYIKLDGSTHPCATAQCGGGVARNMAEALWRLRGGRARLLTAVGDDADGHYLTRIAPGLLLDGCVVRGARTPTYAAIMDARGECQLGLGDMALHNHISIELVKRHMDILEKAPVVIVDGNAPQSTIKYVIQHCSKINKPVFFEPTDLRKATKVLHSGLRIAYASPNLNELRAMARFVKPYMLPDYVNGVDEILYLSKMLSSFIECLIVTLGSKGVIIVRNKDVHGNGHDTTAKLYPVNISENIQNVSGAGDCFASGFLHGVLSNLNEPSCVSIGFDAAKNALLSSNTVPSNFKMATDVKESSYKTLL